MLTRAISFHLLPTFISSSAIFFLLTTSFDNW
jgi:hypothetical protein